VSRDNGVSDQKLLDLDQYARSPHYSEAERVALEYADRVTITSEDVDDALFQRVSSFYTPEEIVELTCTIAFENFLSKLHHALLIESQGFCPIRVLGREAAGRSAAR
jgi:alkylhydroperoxidase family enzyme